MGGASVAGTWAGATGINLATVVRVWICPARMNRMRTFCPAFNLASTWVNCRPVSIEYLPIPMIWSPTCKPAVTAGAPANRRVTWPVPSTVTPIRPCFGLTCWPLAAVGALAIYKHKSNIQRLLAGTENRISFKKS